MNKIFIVELSDDYGASLFKTTEPQSAIKFISDSTSGLPFFDFDDREYDLIMNLNSGFDVFVYLDTRSGLVDCEVFGVNSL